MDLEKNYQTDEYIQNNNGFDIKEQLKRKVPIIGWILNYSLRLFLQDLLAGITVSLTKIPQAIAYAVIAGLPSQYGLYSSFMGCFVYFIFGTCKDLSIGPTAVMALMIMPFVTSMGPAAAILIGFLSGCIIFMLGLLHLGFIVEFFSYPVVAGFTTAAALNIGSTQVMNLLGISGKSDEFLKSWLFVFHHIEETRKWDAVLGFTTMVFLVISKEIRRFGTFKTRPELSAMRNIFGKVLFMFSLTRNATAVIVGSLLGYLYYENDTTPLRLTGTVPGGLPEFTLPPFSTSYNGTDFSFIDMVGEFKTAIIFCPLVALLEHIAIAKSFSKGRTLDATQELIALGLCNIMGSFVQAMPITGSFSRTAINNTAGVRTTTGGVVTGIMVLLALTFLTSTFRYIPKSSLAAVIIVAMYYLCEFHAFHLLWKTKKIDLIPLTTTLIFSLLISLEYGILIGIAVNMIFVLYSSARPKLDIREAPGNIYVIKLKTGLHFAAAEYVRETILVNCRAEKSTVIVNGKNVGNIDVTIARSFSGLNDELTMRDQKLILLNFKESVTQVCVGVNKKIQHCFKDRTDFTFNKVILSGNDQ